MLTRSVPFRPSFCLQVLCAFFLRKKIARRCAFFPQRRAFIIWIFPTATLSGLLFTLKPLDTENDWVSCGCYQTVIKGTFPFPLSLYLRGFPAFRVLLPLAPWKLELIRFVWAIWCVWFWLSAFSIEYGLSDYLLPLCCHGSDCKRFTTIQRPVSLVPSRLIIPSLAKYLIHRCMAAGDFPIFSENSCFFLARHVIISVSNARSRSLRLLIGQLFSSILSFLNRPVQYNRCCANRRYCFQQSSPRS